MTKVDINSKDIIWQYDDVYYLGGYSKYANKVIGGVDGAKEFNQGGVGHRKFESANLVDFKNKSIIDIGFGRGEVLKYCYENGAKSCCGIDYSPSALKFAKQHIGNLNIQLYELAVTDIDQIIETGFDIAYMIDVLEHVSNAELCEFFNKFKCKLNPDCILIAETPCYSHGNYLDMHNNYHSLTSLHNLLDPHFITVDIHTEDLYNGGSSKHTDFVIKCKGLK